MPVEVRACSGIDQLIIETLLQLLQAPFCQCRLGSYNQLHSSRVDFFLVVVNTGNCTVKVYSRVVRLSLFED